MKRTFTTMAALALIVLSANVALAQNREQERYRETEEQDYARQQDFGFGLSVGLNQFTGDVQDKSGGTFEGATNNLLFGGDIIAKWRFTGIEDIGTLHLIGKAGYHPMDGDIQQGDVGYNFENNAILLSLGLQIEVLPQSDIRPYANMGIGVLLQEPTVTATGIWYDRYLRYKGEGTTTAAIPIDIGLIFSVSNNWDMLAYANKTLAFSDNLDGWESNINDNWQSFNLGIVYYFGDAETEVIEEMPPPPPVKKDTDGDGLIDEDEVNLYKTDPTNKDTDGDGCNDGLEVLTMKTKPLIADSDSDGLTDCDERNTHRTDPLMADTDGDGCNDGQEVNDMKTKPLQKDTDGDGLNDCEEVNKYLTNPLIVDTDGDGANDGREVQVGTDPLVADVLKMEGDKDIVLEGINFETAKSTILPESEPILIQAYNTMRVNEDLRVQIQGHTDDRGSNSYNQKLSEARANSVMQWLINRGIDASRMTAVGLGEDAPMVPNDTPENRAKNRRIQFKIIK